MKRMTAVPLLLLSALLIAGCSDSDPGATDAGVQIERGPKTLTVDGDSNGLWWDDAAQVLYLADDNGNRILKWTDAQGFGLVKDLPAVAADSPGLGQLVLTGDGTVVVTRFGGGTAGDVAFVPPSGDAQVVPGLDPQRRRLGLTVTDDGQLIDSWFVRLSNGGRVGAVGSLSLTGTETELVTGLKKPVGVLAVGDSLFISDQDLGQILKAPLTDPTAYTVFATVDHPDLLATGPNGTLFTGSTGGNLYQLTSAGAASVFQSGFQEIHGVAYDPTNHRLFVADHDPDESDGVTHLLHILPVN